MRAGQVRRVKTRQDRAAHGNQCRILPLYGTDLVRRSILREVAGGRPDPAKPQRLRRISAVEAPSTARVSRAIVCTSPFQCCQYSGTSSQARWRT